MVEHNVYGCHSGIAISPPQDVIKLADIDVLVTKSWTEGNQVERIIQVVDSL